jgi:RNA recognition motif-containing protein
MSRTQTLDSQSFESEEQPDNLVSLLSNSLYNIFLVLKYFQNKSPFSTRFEKFFSKLYENINPYTELYKIDKEKIINNKDKRTSIVIKNLPRSIKKKQISEFVSQYGEFNSLYVISRRNKEGLKVNHIYVNLLDYKSIIDIYDGLKKLNFEINGSKCNIEITYSKVQGKEKLKKYFLKYSHK